MARRDLTLNDFFTGLLVGLAARGVMAIPVEGDDLFAAVHSSYLRLEELADDLNVDPRFVILLDPIHADSEAIRQGMAGALLQGVVSVVRHKQGGLELSIDPMLATEMTRRLPGGQRLYDELAAAFLDNYLCTAA